MSMALKIADYAYVPEIGHTSRFWRRTLKNDKVLKAYLGGVS